MINDPIIIGPPFDMEGTLNRIGPAPPSVASFTNMDFENFERRLAEELAASLNIPREDFIVLDSMEGIE